MSVSCTALNTALGTGRSITNLELRGPSPSLIEKGHEQVFWLLNAFAFVKWKAPVFSGYCIE